MTKHDEDVFPENFFDIGLKSFLWVYTHKPKFVDFTKNEMQRTRY